MTIAIEYEDLPADAFYPDPAVGLAEITGFDLGPYLGVVASASLETR